MKHYMFPVLSILTIASLSPAQAAVNKISPAAYSQNFVKKAEIGNQFEISSSQLALDKSNNEQVKQFAQQMITDHNKAGDDLKSTLASNKIPEPTLPASKLDTKHQKILNDLKATSGNKFDAKYIAAQVDAHNETVKLFRDYDQKGQDDSLKSFAEATLPTLETHKQHIDSIASKK